MKRIVDLEEIYYMLKRTNGNKTNEVNMIIRLERDKIRNEEMVTVLMDQRRAGMLQL